MRHMLLTMDQLHYPLKGTGKAAIVVRLALDVHEIGPIARKAFFNQGPYEVMDGDNTETGGGLGFSDTQEFLPAIDVGLEKVPKLPIPQAGVDENQHQVNVRHCISQFP